MKVKLGMFNQTGTLLSWVNHSLVDLFKTSKEQLLNGLSVVVVLFVFGCSGTNRDSFANRDRLINNDWKFIRDSISGAEIPGFDDSKWMTVDLPHDYSIMDLPGEDGADQIGPFSKKSPGKGNSIGHVMGGTGWYRKVFTLDKADEGKKALLNFDGVYMETEVWVNGKKAGTHKNGYTPFGFDITDLLNKPGESNLIAVKVDNIGKNSRWYSGSGIYRSVHLTLTNQVHVGVWGVYITTPEINQNAALVNIEVAAQNDGDKEVAARLKINLKDKNGKLAGSSSEEIVIPANSNSTLKKQISVDNPLLWSLESPNLYQAEIVLEEGNKTTDVYSQAFGIRSIKFSAEKGFLLNGMPVLLKGGCIHHDNGFLGSAAIDRAEVRKVEIMKANGYNAIRCAHNPPSETFLNTCDELGMLVIDEFTDMWEMHKNPQDYSNFFAELWDKDLSDMMKRDRNHPSIIMWSIGNEIPIGTIADGVRIGKQLANRVKELDSTRAVTEAITSFLIPEGWENTKDIFQILDVCGYNYLVDKYKSDHQKFPDRIMFASESYPINAYEYWKAVESLPYVIGDFVWTSMDYIGEVAIGNTSYVPESQKKPLKSYENVKIPSGINVFDYFPVIPSKWPNYISWCGDLDVTGEMKPQMLYRNILWNTSKLEVNVHRPIPKGYVEDISQWGWPDEWPNWNWPESEGKPLKVRVFTKASQVRLELNGKIVGEKTLLEADKYIAVFDVPYQPGELKAIALENGKEIADKILKTTGKPSAIRLIADRNKIGANLNDLSFVKIEVVDENGMVVPQDSVQVKLTISGMGKLAATGNANPKDMGSVNNQTVNTYKGKAQAIIRPSTTPGEIKLSAESNGLNGANLVITTL